MCLLVVSYIQLVYVLPIIITFGIFSTLAEIVWWAKEPLNSLWIYRFTCLCFYPWLHSEIETKGEKNMVTLWILNWSFREEQDWFKNWMFHLEEMEQMLIKLMATCSFNVLWVWNSELPDVRTGATHMISKFCKPCKGSSYLLFYLSNKSSEKIG